MKLPAADLARLSSVEVLFTDIDDTISTEGKITSHAYDALWRAQAGGLKVVPVTGRPAGWCDHIARMWPVSGVVGENGGLYFRMVEDGMERVFMHDSETRAAYRQRLEAVKERILSEVPGAAIASDQTYREYDLAIDFCEDVLHLGRDDVKRIVKIFEESGAHAKVSSIHVNGWYGNFDKLTMARQFAEDALGLNIDEDKHRAAFVGDSPNDEPMFAFFPFSFGVANISEFLDDITSHPSYITDFPSGRGFVEVVETLLNARAQA